MGLLDALRASQMERYRQRLLTQAQVQQQVAAEEAQKQRQQALAEIKPILSPFGAATAGQVGPLLTSTDPGLQRTGVGLLQSLLEQRQALGQPPAPAESLVGKVNPESWTAESLQQFVAGGGKDYGLLKRYEDPNTAARIANQERGLAIREQLAQRPPASILDEAITDEAVKVGMLGVATTAKPEFFGFGFDTVGQAAQEYKRRTGSDLDFTKFWADLESTQGQLRRRMLGLTQSAVELANFDKLAVKPSDGNVKVAMAKLNAQQAIINRLIEARNQAMQSYGYKLPFTSGPSLQDIMGAPDQ